MMADALLSIGAAIVSACLLSLLLVVTTRSHGRFTLDFPGAVQKFHDDPTPRVGGLAIFCGLAAAWTLTRPDVKPIIGTLLLAGMPALVFGLGEDLTKRIGVMVRLIATMASGVLAWLLTGQLLNRVSVPVLDDLLVHTPVAVAFTAFTVAGIANAVNIIDGFHGLAGGITVIALGALGVIAMQVGDPALALACLSVAAAVGGFWLVNYPLGKLFMGDGGAYFTGFALGWLAILLPMRNVSVSPWASLLVCAYPVIEVLYSMIRRLRRRQSPGAPDDLHLHSLLRTRVVARRWHMVDSTRQNAAVAPLLWLMVLPPTAVAVAFHGNTALLATAALCCGGIYHLLYQRLVRMAEPGAAG